MQIKMVVIDFEIPARIKRRLLAVGIPLAILAGAAVAYANVPKTWMKGEALTAADLNANFSDIDARVTTVETAEAMSAQQIMARMKAGSNISIPQGSTSTVAGGPVNPSATQMLWQAGTTVVSTDANALASIIYPTPFPNGVLSVIVVDGDASGYPLFMGLAGTTNTTFFQTKVYDSNAALAPNTQARFNWIAVGW